MIESEAALAALLIRVFGLEAPPKPLHLVQPAIRAVRGEITLAEAAKIAGTTRSNMERIVVSPNPVRAIIGGEIPTLPPEAERSARQSLGQLLIGNLNADWYVLSARRADKLLQDMLFERAYALRVRGFARNYRGAELDMHFSLSGDLSPLTRFLEVLREDGMPGLVSRLERGTF
jgi:hypothetical protein